MVFQWVARYWLQNLAQQKIRETVVNTAKERLAEAVSAAEAEHDQLHERPCDVGVVFALERESGGLEDLLETPVSIRGANFKARHGSLKGRHVIVARSGPGKQAAARTAAALLTGHAPRWIISAGFAGGLDERLRRSDILIADSVADSSGRTIEIGRVDRTWAGVGRGLHIGRLLTADSVVRLPADKRALGQKHQALAVDMETFAVAELCAAQNVPFLAVRAVTDAADDTLPPDVERLMKQKSAAAQWGAAFGAVLNRPGSVKDLYQLKENALLAGDRLASFLAFLVEDLVPVEEKQE